MKKWFGLVAGLLMFGIAFAQSTFPRDLTIQWDLPTSYTDGTTLEPDALGDIRLVCSEQGGPDVLDTLVPVADPPGTRVQHIEPGAIPRAGVYVCVAYAILRDNGLSSGPSNAAMMRFTEASMAPENLQIIVTVTVTVP